MFYVYILFSATHDKYYIGQTADLDTRLSYHNEHNDKGFTARYRPWVVAWSLGIADRHTALRIERYIKRQKSRTYPKALIAKETAVYFLLKNRIFVNQLYHALWKISLHID